jgi:hypothetical protein
MNGKKFLPLVLMLSLAMVVFSTAQAQSLPWVEVWVAVRDGWTGAPITDAQVEIPQCANLPADSCTRWGVWDGTRQVYLLKVPRLEAYDLVVSRSGYVTEMRRGTAVDAVTTWDVRLYPSQGGGIKRVYLPLVLKGDGAPPPVYNPVAAVNRLNWWRMLAGASPVQGNLELHSNCRAHARYMVNQQTAAHTEDPNLPGYTVEGDFCGQAANLGFGVDVYPNDEGAVDALMASPFHALAALDARLVEVGFGSARLDTAWSGSYYAAALDVFHGLDYGRSVSYPWTFPGNGRSLPLLSYDGRGEPNPLTACPGYEPPTGPVLIAAFGEGLGRVAESSLLDGGTALAHCVVTADSYTNPNPELQQRGRTALWAQGAVLVIPRQPLPTGKVYVLRVRTVDNRLAVAYLYAPPAGGLAQPLNPVWMQVLKP